MDGKQQPGLAKRELHAQNLDYVKDGLCERWNCKTRNERNKICEILMLQNVNNVKAAFHFRVFHTHVSARKTLNRLKH